MCKPRKPIDGVRTLTVCWLVAAMNAGTATSAAEPALAEPPFTLLKPAGGLTSPLVFASPHSGRLYPQDMMATSALDAAAIRRSEDAFISDVLIARARRNMAPPSSRPATPGPMST